MAVIADSDIGGTGDVAWRRRGRCRKDASVPPRVLSTIQDCVVGVPVAAGTVVDVLGGVAVLVAIAVAVLTGVAVTVVVGMVVAVVVGVVVLAPGGVGRRSAPWLA